MGPANPADQLQQAMRGARSGLGATANPGGAGALPMHPGAGTGGVQILSDQQGVDFNSWLLRWHRETERTWDPLIPEEVNPPILKKGAVVIRFKVLPSGRLMDGSMVLEGRSGDTALDRAAWGALDRVGLFRLCPENFTGPSWSCALFSCTTWNQGTRSEGCSDLFSVGKFRIDHAKYRGKSLCRVRKSVCCDTLLSKLCI